MELKCKMTDVCSKQPYLFSLLSVLSSTYCLPLAYCRFTVQTQASIEGFSQQWLAFNRLHVG